MSTYERPWPMWTPEEDIMLVYYCNRDFAAADVALIMAHKLHRPARSLRALLTRMERINQDQEQIGLSRLSSNGMAEWDRAAVDNFLIHSTDNADSLQHLLWFHDQYMPLLRTWHRNNVPLNEVLNVRDLQADLERLIRMHRSIYGYPSWGHGGRRFLY